MKTVTEFATRCRTADANGIYELFENSISQELRDAIYNFADSDSPEPCRSALVKVGYMYGVESLINY